MFAEMARTTPTISAAARNRKPMASSAGKTEALRRLAGALASQQDLECTVVLTGVRAE